MLFYTLATLPLIHKLSKKVTQAWYADDASACGKIFISVHGGTRYHAWDQISFLGPAFGYFPNAKKTWLVVKEQYLEIA